MSMRDLPPANPSSRRPVIIGVVALLVVLFVGHVPKLY
jgi:hypothetical protein